MPDQPTIKDANGVSPPGVEATLSGHATDGLLETRGTRFRSSVFGWRPADSPRVARVLWAWLAAVCVLLLAVGWHLKPDPRGVGTHEQLGLAPCSFYLATGLPCPTCGVTTAYATAVHGGIWQAVKIQPVGVIMALATVGLMCLGILGVLSAGVPLVRLSPRAAVLVAFLAATVFLGSWIYKLAVTLAAR